MEELKLAQIKEQHATQQRNTLQINLIFFVVLLLFIGIMVSGWINIRPGIAKALIFIFFILVFEFVLVVMDPYVDNWSGGQPLIKLGSIVCLLWRYSLGISFSGKDWRKCSRGQK